MKVHCIQHVAFETPAYLEKIINKHGHTISTTHVYRGESLPDPSSLDMLLIMGGPMGVNDDLLYPWLPEEKRFIGTCINTHKKVLGICLGAQLLANVLGAEVRKNNVKEIGFFPIQIQKKTMGVSLLKNIPDSFTPFHWHGDVFDIPSETVRFATSVACQNQGFIAGTSIVGLQFHLEVTLDSLQEMIRNCKSELVDEPWIQDAQTMQSLYKTTEKQNHNLMEQIYLNVCNS